MRQALIVLCALIGQSACSPELLVDKDANVRCGVDGSCPADLVCVNGQRCVAPEVIDANGVSPIVPGQDAVVSAKEDIVFAWSTATGAVSYRVEIAADSGFQTLVAGTPSQIDGSSFAVRLPVGTYFWRVASDITSADVTATVHRFGVLDDAIFVDCPPGDACAASDGDELGTPQLPYRSMNRGMAAALRLAIPRVHVATRADGSPYREIVRLLPGVTLSGGYASGFTTQRGRTPVALDDVGLYAAVIAEPTRVEHFTFTNTYTPSGAPGAGTSGTSTAIRIVGCGEDLELSDIAAVSDALSNEVVRVEAGDGSDGPLMVDAEISARYGASYVGRPGSLVAFAVNDAALRLRRTTVSVTPLSSQAQVSLLTALRANDSRLILEATTLRAIGQDSAAVIGLDGSGAQIAATEIQLGIASTTALTLHALRLRAGLRVSWATLSDALIEATGPLVQTVSVADNLYFAIHRSTILARASAGIATAVDVSGLSVDLSSNLIVADGVQGPTQGLQIRGETHGALVNNSLIIGRGDDGQVGIITNGAGMRIVNNAIVGLIGATCAGFCRAAMIEDNSTTASSLEAFAGNALIGFAPDGGRSCAYATGQAESLCIDATGNRDALTPHPYFAGNTVLDSLVAAEVAAPLGVDGILATADDELYPVAPGSPLIATGTPTSLDICRPSVPNAERNIPVPACGAVVAEVQVSPIVGSFEPVFETVARDRDGLPLGAAPPVGAFTPR